MALRPAVLLVAGLLAGCGYKGPVTRLEPPDPALTPEQQRAARAAEKRDVAAGLTLPAQARPVRVDDLTVQLDVRRDDPFSLPPEGTANTRVAPFPGEEPAEDARPLPVPPIGSAGPQRR